MIHFHWKFRVQNDRLTLISKWSEFVVWNRSQSNKKETTRQRKTREAKCKGWKIYHRKLIERFGRFTREICDILSHLAVSVFAHVFRIKNLTPFNLLKRLRRRLFLITFSFSGTFWLLNLIIVKNFQPLLLITSIQGFLFR